ncbi:AKT-interacting protein-like isoform X3 [Centruroides sculpturatus]|uniref:AKT-interacting protein-like isoform X3 n=1 Tax=Centruroides sculpturatus TaxID=218467 RepID=UPI000C6D3832|nr:AKT-interacting protein-like isoform X3 [Centruroides sculpturatus]
MFSSISYHVANEGLTYYCDVYQAKSEDGNGSVCSSQNTVKKILPSVPNTETHLNTSVKRIERTTNNTKANKSYGPYFLEYSLMAEYVLLQKQQLPGLYVVPSAGSALKWFGVLFIRNGLYQGGVFRFTLYVPDKYPDSDPPLLVFEPPIFHPIIDYTTGEMDIKSAFPTWKKNVNHLWQVLQYARSSFYKIETHSPLNQEAASLYEKDIELYKLKVSESINLCNEKLYDRPNTDDPHAIHFSPWESAVHENLRKKLTGKKKEEEQESKNVQSGGLSWVQNGTLKIFSKSVS